MQVGHKVSSVKFWFVFFKNGPFPASFFFIFVYSIQLTVNKCSIVDLNHGPLLMEVTALPTEPQPLPNLHFYLVNTQISEFKV